MTKHRPSVRPSDYACVCARARYTNRQRPEQRQLQDTHYLYRCAACFVFHVAKRSTFSRDRPRDWASDGGVSRLALEPLTQV